MAPHVTDPLHSQDHFCGIRIGRLSGSKLFDSLMESEIHRTPSPGSLPGNPLVVHQGFHSGAEAIRCRARVDPDHSRRSDYPTQDLLRCRFMARQERQRRMEELGEEFHHIAIPVPGSAFAVFGYDSHISHNPHRVACALSTTENAVESAMFPIRLPVVPTLRPPPLARRGFLPNEGVAYGNQISPSASRARNARPLFEVLRQAVGNQSQIFDDQIGHGWKSASPTMSRRGVSQLSSENVPQPPSWPVLSAASRSATSAPRTSPTTSRSGLIRSAWRTRSARVTRRELGTVHLSHWHPCLSRTGQAA